VGERDQAPRRPDHVCSLGPSTPAFSAQKSGPNPTLQFGLGLTRHPGVAPHDRGGERGLLPAGR